MFISPETIWEKKNEIGAVIVIIVLALFLILTKCSFTETGTPAIASLDKIIKTPKGTSYELIVRQSKGSPILFRARVGPELNNKTKAITSKKLDREKYFNIRWKEGKLRDQKIIVEIGEDL